MNIYWTTHNPLRDVSALHFLCETIQVLVLTSEPSNVEEDVEQKYIWRWCRLEGECAGFFFFFLEKRSQQNFAIIISIFL